MYSATPRNLYSGLWAASVICLLGLAGCSSLPRIVPDLARPAGQPVLLEDARGPLSAARSRAILGRLERRSQDTGIFERHLAEEDAIVGSPLTTGNEVRLLQDGPATYQAMYAAIMKATDHINLETYILDDDVVGQRFAQALITKQQQGVQVNLIHDSVGTLETPVAYFQQLADSGVQVLEFNPVNPMSVRAEWTLNQRDHRKLLIVDGHTAFLGGINISSVYSGGSFKSVIRKRTKNRPPPRPTPESAPESTLDAVLAWRDTDLQLRGPVVAEFQKLFVAAWENQKGPPLAEKNYFPPLQNVGRELVRAIGSSPEEPYSQIYATLLSTIASAETSVQITNAYFVPDPQLLDALEAAAGRGVRVALILPSRTDSWLVFHAGRRYYERLLRGGVKIFERRGVILHSKTALIDGVWATVGSTNLDWRSFLHNYELNAVVLGSEFGKQVQAMFDRDLAMSDEITLEKWQRRGLSVRLKELFAGIWEYWL